MARVVRLRFRSLDMLDPARVARDMSGPEPLLARLRAALGPERRAVVVLEGPKLFSFVVAALVAVRDALKEAGGGLALVVGARERVVLDLLGVGLERFGSTDEALAAKGWSRAGPEADVAYEVVD